MIRLSDSVEAYWEHGPRILKNGKFSKRWYSIPIYYTPLQNCELCGKLGTPRKVCYRNSAYGWVGNEGYEPLEKNTLCLGCWNKVRPIVEKQKELAANKKLLNKLLKVARDERRKNNQD